MPQARRVLLHGSPRYYTDGRCLRPRLPEVRVAAWAVVGRSGDGAWWSQAGPCPGLQTIGRAELAAVVHVLLDAEPGTIVTDCLGIKTKCVAILRGQVPMEAVLKGANADLWWEVWQVLRKVQCWTFEWLPRGGCSRRVGGGLARR